MQRYLNKGFMLAAATLAASMIANKAHAQTTCRVQQRNGQGIQSAIDECTKKGGGVVSVPTGLTVSGPIWMKDNVELHLEPGALVKMSRSLPDWRQDAPALINADGARNISFTGQGTFDGAGTWDYEPVKRVDVEIAEEQANAQRAGVEMNRYYHSGEVLRYLFLLRNSQNIRFEGITVKNAPYWNVRLQDCDGVRMRGISVFSDLERGVNSDGIDIVSTSNVIISDSTIITADDAICLKAENFDEPTKAARPVENVLVTNCILGSSSTPMMIGTETFADIKHVVFSNIVVRNANKVFGINVQDGGTVSDVRFSNVTFETNRRHWNWWGSAEVMKFVLRKRTPASGLGRIEHITIDGVQGTARGTSLLRGQTERPLHDIRISNLHVRMLPEDRPDKRATSGFVFEDIDQLSLRDVHLEWDTQSPEPKWGSAFVFRRVHGFDAIGLKGKAAAKGKPAIVKESVTP